MMWGRLSLAGAGLLLCAVAAAAEFRTQLSFDQVSADLAPGGFSPNAAFVPLAEAAPAREPFSGTLVFSETRLSTTPVTFTKKPVLGKDPQIFPAVALAFTTVNGDLVPASQDVIRNGSLGQGNSYWDILVQPGKVWSEPGDEDGWSRASFPFALVHSLEGETHNGVAMFLYRGKEVRDIRYQIVQQTAPFLVEDLFTAAGVLTARYEAGPLPDEAKIRSRFEASLADAEPIGSWGDLEAKVGADKLAGFNSDIRPDEIVLDGLIFEDRFYLKSCPSAAGELAYCDRQRFGVWSITKSATATTAMLRLAEKYGAEIFALKIIDFVPEAKGIDGWERVSFGDALNMATGMGHGSVEPEPVQIEEPLDGPYQRWYEARDLAGKLNETLAGVKRYPWEPSTVARYRDQDMFLLGVAMTRFLQTKEGPDANVWAFLVREVFEPIGIHYAPTNKTLEGDPARGQPLMAFGWYPTVGDIVKIARLYANNGRHGDKQILNVEMLADLRSAGTSIGLRTGNPELPRYHKGFWRAEFTSLRGCSFAYPVMSGWGRSFVSFMPRGITTIRLARNLDGDPGSAKLASLADVADRLADLCH